ADAARRPALLCGCARRRVGRAQAAPARPRDRAPRAGCPDKRPTVMGWPPADRRWSTSGDVPIGRSHALEDSRSLDYTAAGTEADDCTCELTHAATWVHAEFSRLVCPQEPVRAFPDRAPA